jgi:hypothetical protein
MGTLVDRYDEHDGMSVSDRASPCCNHYMADSQDPFEVSVSTLRNLSSVQEETTTRSRSGTTSSENACSP